jgi:hypothetical protein
MSRGFCICIVSAFVIMLAVAGCKVTGIKINEIDSKSPSAELVKEE